MGRAAGSVNTLFDRTAPGGLGKLQETTTERMHESVGEVIFDFGITGGQRPATCELSFKHNEDTSSTLCKIMYSMIYSTIHVHYTI